MDKKNKIILLNSLVFLFCVIIIILYCLVFPTKNTEIAQLQTYEITFDTDGGSIIPSMSIEEGHAIEAPDAPTREGYIFEGWMLGDNEYDFSGTVNGNIVLKAKWTEITPEMVIYTVTFDTAGGSEVSSIQVLENGNAYAPTTTREGYVFVEWQLNGEAFDFNTPITGDITLTAVWREEDQPDPNEGKEWTVTFNLNGGSGSTPSSQKVVHGEKATVPSERPTRDKYDFIGWSTNRNTTSANINSFVIRNNTTFYAIWRSNITYYNVTLSGGGSGCSNQRIEEGQRLTNCTPTRNNYTFNGWQYGSTTYRNLSDISVSGNITITATWTENPKYNYSITYVTNTDKSCSNQVLNNSYDSSHTFTINCNPGTPNALKVFDYWDGNGTHYSNSITLRSSNPTITLTAHYKDGVFNLTCVETKGSGGGGSNFCIPKINDNTNSSLVLKKGKTIVKVDGSSTIANNTYNSPDLKVCLANDNSVCVSPSNKADIVYYS